MLELTFEELYSEDVPDLVSRRNTITPEEVEAVLSYVLAHGVREVREGLWVNAGFRARDGRLVMTLHEDSTPAEKLYELVHMQHMLEAKRAGARSSSMVCAESYRNALAEVIAGKVERDFLESCGGSETEKLDNAMYLEFWSEELGKYGVEDPFEVEVNPYLWELG